MSGAGLAGAVRAQEVGPAPGVPVPEGTGWGDVFVPFSGQHLVVVVACALATAVVLRLGWVWRGQRRELLLRRVLGVGALAGALVDDGYWMFVAPYEIGRAYPLQLCDLVAWSVAIAMLTELRWARTLVFFLGLALSTQGFFTPVLRFGHEHVRFWLFWIGHTQIVAGALYFFIVSGYRPRGRDFGVAVGVTAGWLAIVFPLNLVLGTNYGYVGRIEPENPTIVQELGPWPWRVLLMAAMTLVAFTAVWMIGAGVARFEGRREMRGETVKG